MSASWWEKNNGGGEQDSTWRGERQCFNEVHPDSRVLVYSSAKLRDFVYGATQLWELFYCRAYIWWYSAVIQYAVQRGGALLKIEWRRPLGTTCSLSAQSPSATVQHTKRSLHKISVFFSLLHSKDGRPPPSAPACRRTRCSVMLRTIKKGQNLIANSLTQCKGLLSWVTKARAAQCTLDNSDCTSQCPDNSLNFIIIYLTNWTTGIPLQRLEFFKLSMI